MVEKEGEMVEPMSCFHKKDPLHKYPVVVIKKHLFPPVTIPVIKKKPYYHPHPFPVIKKKPINHNPQAGLRSPRTPLSLRSHGLPFTRNPSCNSFHVPTSHKL
uniref:Uncharacterized protein n=1 Tax=Kalanchoe fedtschenkoi TaxID=63787 RepID=A0A7N0TCX2_KALFE